MDNFWGIPWPASPRPFLRVGGGGLFPSKGKITYVSPYHTTRPVWVVRTNAKESGRKTQKTCKKQISFGFGKLSTPSEAEGDCK